MKNEEITIGGIGVLISVYVLYTTTFYPKVSGNDVGVAFFPQMLAVLMCILSSCLIFHAVRGTSVHSAVKAALITPGALRAATALLIT